MSQEIIVVGAGPIGLWLAVQVKLQRPDVTIIFKEKYETYQRTHTLKLEHQSFTGCLQDESGIIQGIAAAIKNNPHMRTDFFESKMLQLATSLGIFIDYERIENIEQDIASKYPECAMIIGADGVRSLVREQAFGPDNAERIPLAYSAQIKYFVSEDHQVSINSLESYSLLKHSNFLSFTSVGQQSEGKTPVTIQHFIDQATFEQISHVNFRKPVKLFSDDVEQQLPPELLRDIKTQLGFRLAAGENILVDSVRLTATELPQQRCKKTVVFKDNRYYVLTGDAALALSFFKGMNAGLQLATQLSKSIADDWDKILQRDNDALNNYSDYYDRFATAAIAAGQRTGSSLFLVNSGIHAMAYVPIQFQYYTNDEIAKYQRYFNVCHQVSQFYLKAHPEVSEEVDVNTLDHFLTEQLTALPSLVNKVQQLAESYHDNVELQTALRALANIKTQSMSRHEKAYYVLAMSKTCDLLDEPTPDKYEQYIQFHESLKTAAPSLFQVLGAIFEVVMGVAAVVLGIALIITSPASALIGAPVAVAGALLTGHGLFQVSRNITAESEVYQAVHHVAELIPTPQ